MHHWSFNGILNDYIGGEIMTLDQNGTFASDRNNRPDSSVSFVDGFGSFSESVYFDPSTSGLFSTSLLFMNNF